MDAAALGRLDRLGAAVDILEAGAREAADHGVLGALGDLVDRGEIALGGDREAGLDDVDAHLVEQLGDFELLSCVMVAPGHCSPSRKVVSKMRTRSFSDFTGSALLGSDLAFAFMM